MVLRKLGIVCILALVFGGVAACAPETKSDPAVDARIAAESAATRALLRFMDTPFPQDLTDPDELERFRAPTTGELREAGDKVITWLIENEFTITGTRQALAVKITSYEPDIVTFAVCSDVTPIQTWFKDGTVRPEAEGAKGIYNMRATVERDESSQQWLVSKFSTDDEGTICSE